MTTSYAARRVAGALGALALAGVMGLAGCNDFLQGGELSTDPVRSTVATNRQLFVGVQSNTFATTTSDLARVVGVWSGQFSGIQSQYYTINQYGVSEQTTNGFNAGIYAGGGLKDVRALQDSARSQGDTLFLGIAQVQEALLVGTAADLFGDIVYSQALKGTPNPALDKQMDVYDAIQTLLDNAIANLSSFSSAATNLGPGASDLNYGGDPDKWIALAHTLKARFYLHTAEVRGNAAYSAALAQARLGITDPADDYKAIFSGAGFESNFWYQFTIEQRFGYLTSNENFVNLLEARGDPRLDEYFDPSGDYCGEPRFCLTGDADTDNGERIDPGFDQPIVTAQENLLIWAEAAYRTGATGEAQTELDRELAISGGTASTVGLDAAGVSCTGLLCEILTEKYIALFQNIEVYNDYKRTCFPNLTPNVAGLKIPARLLYDTAERQTNSSIPGAQDQPTRNQNDPANATDPFGNVCRGQ